MNNPRDGIDAPSEWVTARRAAALLGVKRETLYAYASRGLLRSRPVAGARERLYRRADLLRLKARRDARSGHGAVAAGALRWGEPVLDSSLTEIAPGGHRYRGRSAVELGAGGVAFERVAELLWTGVLPDAAAWPSPAYPIAPARLAALLPRDARPLDVLAVALPVLAVDEAMRVRPFPTLGREVMRLLVASLALASGARRVERALAERSTARSFLVALGVGASRRAAAAVDAALVLCADHELNPSSFSARVTASVGADLYACLGAALATLSGPAHGRMADRVEALLAEARRPEDAARVVRDRLQRGDDVPGFGHPLYPGGDPRSEPLLAAARALAPRSAAVRTVDALLDAMSLAGAEPPTVDVGLVALAAALRLPPGSAPALFAAGRAAGWIAHAIEQRAAGFVLRPRARYVPGPG